MTGLRTGRVSLSDGIAAGKFDGRVNARPILSRVCYQRN